MRVFLKLLRGSLLQNARVKKYMKCQRVSESKENLFSVRTLYTTLGNFRYLVSRDVDNNRKPGKLPGCERDFSGCEDLFSFVYTFKSRYSVPKAR